MISFYKRLAAPAAVAAGVFLFSQRADAFINAGVEVGVVKRYASPPLDLALGYGLHGEIGLLPFITLGPYFLHYEPSGWTFNVVGGRARLTLPLPVLEPYAYVGVGYTWASVDTPLAGAVPGVDLTGHFVEIPIGFGVQYSIIPIFKGSLDFAYRPGSGFGGNIYEVGGVDKPIGGFSLMLGIALDL